MDEAVVYNRRVEKNKKFQFELQFKKNGVFIDVSTWQFHFYLINSIKVIKWDIENAGFTRPNNYTINFEKTPEEVFAIETGNYTISLLETNDDMIDNEIMNGIWFFD